jgi:dTDP-glucose pyrophosphorylase
MSQKILNIVVPMAGAGSRFAQKGYVLPKPLIDVHGVPMIKVVINNLKPSSAHRFIFICQKKHNEIYSLEEQLMNWAPEAEVVEVDGLTEGAACTVLAARRFIDNDQPLMIANSDQYVDVDIDKYLSHLNSESLDGLIMTMYANDNKWSYIGFSDNGRVSNVVEKQVISNEATVGIYNFARGSDFVAAAEKMIDLNLRVNNEFYVAPVYNQMIKSGANIGYHNIGGVNSGMYGLGVPEDLQAFLGMPISIVATKI